MKNGSVSLVRPMAIAAVAALLLVAVGAGSAMAEGSDITVTLSKLDITHGVGMEPVDQVDLIANFNNTEASEGGKCDPSADLPTSGFVIGLEEGSCGASAETVTIPALSKIGKNRYKFEGVTKEGATADATLTRLGKSGGSCGRWHLVLDATPVDLSSIQTNPVATSITLPDNSSGCLSVNARIDR